MTFFDLFVFGVVCASVAAGAMRGLVRALLTGVALVVGLVVASRGYEAAGVLLRGAGLVESTEAASAGGFLLIVAACLVAGFACGALARRGLRRARLEWFDRALGAAFGLLRGAALCSVVYLALTAFPVRIAAVEESASAPALAVGARIVSACTSEDVRGRFVAEYRKLSG